MKEDFSLKKDVIQLQKKMADFELAVTEVKEAASKVDSSVIDDLKQRLGDVEDLTMVENAGVIELKKMLESSQTSAQIPDELKGRVEEFTNRLTAIEEKSSAVPQLDTTQIEELKTNFENLKAEIEEKLSEVRTNVPNIDLVTNEIRREVNRSADWLKSEVNSIVEERASSLEKETASMNEKLSKLPSGDEINSVVDGLSSSFKSFRTSIETRFQTEENKLEERWAQVEDKFSLLKNLSRTVEEVKSDMQMKKEGLENMISSIEEKLRMPMHERAVRELEKIRNDWIVNNARVDTIETLVKTAQKQFEEIRPALKKIETFDKLVDLHADVTRKLGEMKQYLEMTKKIAESVSQAGDVEKKFEKGLHEINKFKDSIARLQDDMSIFQGNLMTLEQGKLDITSSVAELQGTKADLNKRLGFNENIIDSLQKELSESKNELYNLSKAVGRIKSIENALKERPKDDVGELLKKIESLEAEIEAVKSLKPEDTTSGLVKKINELGNRIEAMQSIPIFDEQMNEVVSRLVFLESRLAAMEGMIQDIPRYSPIVVE